MPKDTPSIAKNKIKRSLIAILDPHPSEADVSRLWQHFQSACAYCGLALDRNSRQGHVDHATSSAYGGTNSIHSHILACGRCNGDEKREESWQTFLPKKCSSPDVLTGRRVRIEEWLAMEQCEVWRNDRNKLQRAEEIVKRVIASFDEAVADMRRLRDGA